LVPAGTKGVPSRGDIIRAIPDDQKLAGAEAFQNYTLRLAEEAEIGENIAQSIDKLLA